MGMDISTQPAGPFLYFGYGSNLDVDRLRMHCPSAQFVSIARLADFRLAFSIESKHTWLGGVGDMQFESNGVRLFVDPVSISYLRGAEVDFVDTITGGGFTIKNPNAKSTCGCGQSFSAD